MSMKNLSPEQREEVDKAFAANRAYQESLMTDRVPGRAEFTLALVQAVEDAPLFSEEVQSELRATKEAIKSHDIEVAAPFMVMDSPGAGGGYVGEFVIPLAQIAAPIITGIAGAWLHGKFGRKVRLEFFSNGQLKKLEANTAQDVGALIELVRDQGEPRPLRLPK
jgi:hypothetical protein